MSWSLSDREPVAPGYDLRPVSGGVLAASGFRAAPVAAGVKRSGKLDLLILDAGRPVPAAAVFTLNAMAAPPVAVSREAIASGSLRAWVVNAGNANACTGSAGLAHAREMAAATADALGCDPLDVAVASTGVIGVPLPMARVTPGIDAASRAFGESEAHDTAAAESIMTTDTFSKSSAWVVMTPGGASYTVGGIAKGSGMIMPNMATMLAFLTTDAPLTPVACETVLREAVDPTFNRISVDGDTSTNDTASLMASGTAGDGPIDVGHPDFDAIAIAVHRVCADLARMIVRDGEGATRVVSVRVCGASSVGDAEHAARAVATSPLFKTAIFGKDANWGRVAMAIGNSSASIDPARVEIVFAGITTCKNGMAVGFSEEAAAEALGQEEVEVVVDLHLGSAEATVLTCDLSYEYVRINGEYRT